MNINRRIIVQAIKTKENILIPIWDERVRFEKTEMYGNILTLDGVSRMMNTDVVECIYDLKTKKLELGVELNYYPDESTLTFKKGQAVFVETQPRVLTEAIISDIIYTEYNLTIARGNKVDSWIANKFKEIKFEKDQIYSIKYWKPFYLLDNGTIIEWEHNLFIKK